MPAPVGYRQAFRLFSRNAKLYLGYASMSGVNSSIFLVAFAFYLEELYGGETASVTFLGLPMAVPAFIGLALALQALAHGANSLPSGFIGDKFGRKRSFVLASLMAVFAGVAILLTTDTLFLVLLAVVVGMGEAFHGVVGGPFLMENSREQERMHLFTLDGVLSTLSSVGGAFLGAFLPALFMAMGQDRLGALRLTLFTALPFGLIELLPLAFMKESYAPSPLPLRHIVTMRHVAHKGTVGRLSFATLAYAAGLGFYLPLLALHLGHEHGAHSEEFGPIVAANSLAIAVAILAVPLFVRRLGKVRTITLTRLAAVPFLVALAFATDLTMVAVFFVARGALASLAMPVAGAFTMEVVDAPERATTAGFTHFAFDAAYGATIFLAGLLLAANGFWIAFLLGGLLYVLHVLLWQVFFSRHPVELASRPGLSAD